jgi:hypothetical protein
MQGAVIYLRMRRNTPAQVQLLAGHAVTAA